MKANAALMHSITPVNWPSSR